MFLLVERPQPRAGSVDIGFDVADFGGRIDELLIEFTAILAQRIDLGFELGLVFRGLALAGKNRIKLLIVLFERIRTVERRRGLILRRGGLRRGSWETGGDWETGDCEIGGAAGAAGLMGAWPGGANFGEVCARAAGSKPKSKPNGSTSAKPSTRRGSGRLDHRRIIVFKGTRRPQEGKRNSIKQASLGRD